MNVLHTKTHREYSHLQASATAAWHGYGVQLFCVPDTSYPYQVLWIPRSQWGISRRNVCGKFTKKRRFNQKALHFSLKPRAEELCILWNKPKSHSYLRVWKRLSLRPLPALTVHGFAQKLTWNHSNELPNDSEGNFHFYSGLIDTLDFMQRLVISVFLEQLWPSNSTVTKYISCMEEEEELSFCSKNPFRKTRSLFLKCKEVAEMARFWTELHFSTRIFFS